MSDQINEVPATSPNFQSEVAQKLASLFPEVIADGKIDVAALQTLLGEDAVGGVSVLARKNSSYSSSANTDHSDAHP